MRIIAVLGLTAVPAILLVVFLQIQQEFAESRSLRASVEQSAAVRDELMKLLSDYQDIEVGQRGYVVTGNPAFLKPYDLARKRIAARFADLGALPDPIAGNVRIKDLSERKVAFAAETIALVEQGKSDAARTMVADGDGRRLMDALRSEIARLDRIEADRLAGLTRERDRKRDSAERTINLALGGLAALLVLLSLAIWRMLRLRHLALLKVNELNNRNRAIFDSAVDGMLVLDREGYIQEANPSVTRLFGFTHDELVGMHNTGLMANPPPLTDSLAWLQTVGPAGARGSGEQQEFIGRRTDQSTLATDVSVSRVSDGVGACYVAVIRDVTERKRIEQMKTEFVSTVSHELRTPLTSIGGSLGLLSAGAAGPLSDKAARLVSIAHSNCERLIRLINDILDVEKIESGKMQFDLRRMVLGPLVERTAAANRAFGETHGVAIETAMPPWPIAVMGDPDRLEQLLTNLISNAVKHSPAGGVVEVSVASSGGRARVSVSDRGEGIPEGFRGRIFGKFAMADGSDSRRRGGTGLGLAIAREIADRHAGHLGFEDRAGGGTVFTFDLPLADCEEAASPIEIAAGLPNVLHIDDDADCLAVVANAFLGRANVVSVPSLGEARRQIERGDLAGVIVDVVLQPENGLDLIPDLRKLAPALPIVVFTALDDTPPTAGVDAILVKSRSAVDTLVETTMALVARARREAA